MKKIVDSPCVDSNVQLEELKGCMKGFVDLGTVLSCPDNATPAYVHPFHCRQVCINCQFPMMHCLSPMDRLVVESWRTLASQP